MSSDSFFLHPLPGFAEDRIDPSYRNLRDLDRAAPYKAFIEHLWTRFKFVAEPDFRVRAATDLHWAFWEMYLYAAMRQHGLKISRTRDAGPDFVVATSTGRTWIEATAPGPGEGPDAVPPLEYAAPVARLVPEEQILMRYTAALRDKAAQFERAVTAKRVRAVEPYLVAINSRDIYQPTSGTLVPFYLKAFLPIGRQAFAIEPRTGKVVDRRVTYRREVIKRSGSSISTDSFLSGAYPSVSAVLHSHVDCANYPQALGDDFEILHNPRAVAPLSNDVFAFCKQVRVQEDGEFFWLDERAPQLRA